MLLNFTFMVFVTISIKEFDFQKQNLRIVTKLISNYAALCFTRTCTSQIHRHVHKTIESRLFGF